MKQAAPKEVRKVAAVQFEDKKAVVKTNHEYRIGSVLWFPDRELSPQGLVPDLKAIPDSRRAPMLLHLQRTYGNRFVQQVVSNYSADSPPPTREAYHGYSGVDAHAPECSPADSPNLRRKTTEKGKDKWSSPERIRRLIQKTRGHGKSLDPDTQSQMEAEFGHDFSEVKIHTDLETQEAARDLNAEAFTVGKKDIYFGEGKYQPSSSEGQTLLAHELAHTIQQEQNDSPDVELTVGEPEDRYEQAAEQAAERLALLPDPNSLEDLVNSVGEARKEDTSETEMLAETREEEKIGLTITGKAAFGEKNITSLISPQINSDESSNAESELVVPRAPGGPNATPIEVQPGTDVPLIQMKTADEAEATAGLPPGRAEAPMPEPAIERPLGEPTEVPEKPKTAAVERETKEAVIPEEEQAPATPEIGPVSAGEPAGPPPPLQLEGDAAQSMEQFANASASQIAATYPQLGEKMSEKLDEERQATVETTPPLKIQMKGKEEGRQAPSEKGLEKPAAKIGRGTTQAEPPPQKTEPQRDLAPQRDNKAQVNRTLNRGPVSGFLDWLRDSFSNLLRGISTTDPGVNTKVKDRPQFDATGEANPTRASKQREEGVTQVQDQRSKFDEQIKRNPGEERIQPVFLDEEAPIKFERVEGRKPGAEPKESITDYAALPIPAEVRQAADAKLAPALSKSLERPRQEVAQAKAKKEEERQAAIQDAQQQSAEMGMAADQEQTKAVMENRRKVTEEKQKGLERSKKLVENLDTETNEEQQKTVQEVHQRIEEDQKKADEHIRGEEARAEAEKKRGEEEAAAKKKEMEAKSKEASWWDRAVSAIKDAVRAVTEAIDAVFTAVRKAIKDILDKAQKFALDLIEAGRKWVIDKIDKFGNWLKDKVNKYLGDFPLIANAINSAIDNAVVSAKKVVNTVAEDLKAGVKFIAAKVGKALDKILSVFQGTLKFAVNFTGALLTGDFSAAAQMVFEAALELIGAPVQRFMSILNKARDAVIIIINDPIGFLKNLLGAVKKGFGQFADNFLTHLKAALLGWLFGTLAEAGIQVPTEFNLKAIFGLVMQVLGLTKEKIFEKLKKTIGPKNVERLKAIWEWLTTFIREGPAGLWELIKEKLRNLKDMVLDAIKDWVIFRIVKTAVTKLATMFNPVGAIVQAIITIYNTMMFFIERIQQILQLVEAIMESLYNIAVGAIGSAANWIEKTMGRALTVIVSFLARLVGIGGIANKIGKLLRSIQEKVDKALDWLIEKGKVLVQKGLAALGLGKAPPAAKPKEGEIEAPVVTFTAAGTKHRLWTEFKAGKVVLIVASNGKSFDGFIAGLEKRVEGISEEKKKSDVQGKIGQAKQMANETKVDFAKVAAIMKAGKSSEAGPKEDEVLADEQKLANLLQSILELLPDKAIYEKGLVVNFRWPINKSPWGFRSTEIVQGPDTEGRIEVKEGIEKKSKFTAKELYDAENAAKSIGPKEVREKLTTGAWQSKHKGGARYSYFDLISISHLKKVKKVPDNVFVKHDHHVWPKWLGGPVPLSYTLPVDWYQHVADKNWTEGSIHHKMNSHAFPSGITLNQKETVRNAYKKNEEIKNIIKVNLTSFYKKSGFSTLLTVGKGNEKLEEAWEKWKVP